MPTKPAEVDMRTPEERLRDQANLVEAALPLIHAAEKTPAEPEPGMPALQVRKGSSAYGPSAPKPQ